MRYLHHLIYLLFISFSVSGYAQKTRLSGEKLLYHEIVVNPTDNTIRPWYSNDLGKSYDFVVNATWNFWNNMRTDKNGLPYYMNHQVWRGDFNDRRGVGGDQFAMALSSILPTGVISMQPCAYTRNWSGNQTQIRETNLPNEEGWSWNSLEKGGVLTIRHQNGNRIAVMGN